MIRLFDILFSLIGILIVSPLLLIIAVVVKLSSSGHIIFSQNRVGKNNVDFKVFKFRTMFVDSEKKSLITIGGKDNRITNVGYFLRKYKLDELPQLFNVLVGQMSLVGPRPEVRKYVDLYTKDQINILNIRPGITDWASIIFRNENELLEMSSDPEFFYINTIIPKKVRLNQIYLKHYNLKEYFRILMVTSKIIIYPNFKPKIQNIHNDKI